MNRALLPSLAALALVLSPAPAFAVTTQNDVISACTVNTALTQSLKLDMGSWGKIMSTEPQELQVDPKTGLPIMPDFSMGTRFELTPTLPVLPLRGAFYRMYLAETGGTPTAGDTCKSAIASYIAATGAVGAALDKLLGELAYKLVTSPNLNANTGALVALALKEIAGSATSADLKSTITKFADDAADGTVASLPPKPPSATNPSGN